MSAPQILRVGTREKVFVEIQDYEGTENINVNIRVMNFPSKDTDLTSVPVTLDTANSYSALVTINVSQRHTCLQRSKLQDKHVFHTSFMISMLVYIRDIREMQMKLVHPVHKWFLIVKENF